MSHLPLPLVLTILAEIKRFKACRSGGPASLLMIWLVFLMRVAKLNFEGRKRHVKTIKASFSFRLLLSVIDSYEVSKSIAAAASSN